MVELNIVRIETRTDEKKFKVHKQTCFILSEYLLQGVAAYIRGSVKKFAMM